MTSNILANLEETYQIVASMPPIPIAVWFIDRRGTYYKFLSAFGEETIDLEMGTAYIGTRNLPLYVWSLWEIEEKIEKDESAERFFPFRKPGVWVEMNNGEHFEILSYESEK